MTRRRPFLAHLSPLLLAALAVSTAAAGELPEPVTSVEGITEYRLDNGLQVLLFPDPSQPTVTVNVTYLVGSRHEGRGEAGMAHLLEHMVFKGTDKHENIWGALEDHGARFNGTTWVDRTNYFETLPATDENLEFAIAMEADRMVNSRVSAEDLASEFTVVRNEFERGQNFPTWVLSERMMSSAYLWHNYGKSTIGNRSDIERVPATNLRAFYENYYQPDNAMLVVAGKFDPEKTLALIQEHFGKIPRPERKLADTYTVEPTQDGARFVTLRRVGDVAVAGLIYHVTAGAHPDFAAIQVLEGVLTAEPAGRLYKALVEPGIATSVDGAAYPWAEPGVLEIQAEMRLEQDPRQVLDIMTQVAEGLAEQEITDAEVERIKTKLLKNIKLAMTSSGRIGVQLSEWAALGDWRMFFLHRDRLKEVTTADVKRVAATYLIESNRTAGLFIPTKEPKRAPIPETPNVAALVDGYEGSEVIEQGEVFAATPENIESRTQRLEPRPGMKLALLAKETRGDAVLANLRFHIGTEESIQGHTLALELLPEALMRGTGSRTYQELRDAIDRLQSRLTLNGGMGTVDAAIESDHDNVVAVIELLSEVLQTPVFSPEEFEIVKKEKLAAAEEALSDPQRRAGRALSRALNPFPKDSVHYVRTLEERVAELEALTLDDLVQVYGDLYGAGDVEIAVVGDFDPAAVTATLERVFGGWKSPSPYEPILVPFRASQAQSLTLLTPDKQMAMLLSGANFEMRDDHEDFPAIDFASYVLGRSAKSRLLERLRQKEGLSYGAGAFLRTDERQPRSTLGSYAICAPQNAEKAQAILREEVDKWISGGVTEEELAEGKVSYSLQFDNRLANDGFVVRELVDGLEHDRTMDFRASIVRKVKSLAKAEVAEALTEHLGDVAWVEVKAGDFEAGEGEAEKMSN